MEEKTQKIILTKISDDVFEGFHPNGYDVGCIRIGSILSPPTVGHKLYVMGKHLGDTFQTSIVTEIVSTTDDEVTFKTQNSTYKMVKYQENPNINPVE